MQHHTCFEQVGFRKGSLQNAPRIAKLMSLFQMKSAHFQVGYVCPEGCLNLGSDGNALLLLRESALCLTASPVGRGRVLSAAQEGSAFGFL